LMTRDAWRAYHFNNLVELEGQGGCPGSLCNLGPGFAMPAELKGAGFDAVLLLDDWLTTKVYYSRVKVWPHGIHARSMFPLFWLSPVLYNPL
jgi:hypothetical protein